MEIRLLSDHREDLVKERTRMINRLRWHLLELCPGLEAKLKRGALSELRALERLDRQLRRLAPNARLRIAREELAHIRALTRDAKAIESQLLELIRGYRPRLLDEQGCGTLTAALLIGRTAGAERFRSDACFGRQSGTAPIPCSSGHANSAPARPRRRPPTQPGATHDRDHPRSARPRDSRVPRAQRSRGQDPQGRVAMPQAPPRAPLLAAAHRATAQTCAGNRAGAHRQLGRARADHHP